MNNSNNHNGNNNQHTGTSNGSPQQGGLNNNLMGGGLTDEQMMNLNAARMGQAGMGGMGGMGMSAGMGGMGMGMGMGMGSFGNAFGMQTQGDMGGGGMENFLGQNGGFVPELDMMALLRAKQKLNMMNRNAGGVQDKLFAFQDQLNKSQGMPMGNRPEDFQVSSAMIDKLKRSAEDMGDDGDDDPKGKKRKKAKKPTDMPRRALSAYNIFFSEQREIILKEIAAEEKGKMLKDEGKSEDEIAEILKADADADEAQKKKDEDEEKRQAEEAAEDDEIPNVMNRTFFPSRAKRAHRKVHGKIGLVSLAREVSARWKGLAPEKRKHYQDLAEKDRERHKKVMADYQERKAAENMISMGSPAHESQDAPAAPPAESLGRSANDQDIRDSMAQQYQQRILAEMMARQQQAAAGQQMMGMGMMGAGMMGMGGGPQPSSFLGMGGMGGMGGMMGQGQGGNLSFQGADPSLLGLNMNNPAQAQMWRQMGMGPL